jgi:hypothetical protein
MGEDLLLDEAARLYALSRQGDCRSRILYRQVALACCQVATELRAARQFPAGGEEEAPAELGDGEV